MKYSGLKKSKLLTLLNKSQINKNTHVRDCDSFCIHTCQTEVKRVNAYACLQSTYCSAIVKHAADERKTVDVVNLDPAAEYFDYQPLVDIRELIHLDDAMDDGDLKFGPNGGLVFCME
jgi:hypothetical protein